MVELVTTCINKCKDPPRYKCEKCNVLLCYPCYQSIDLKTGTDSAGPAINDSDIIGVESGDTGIKIRISRELADKIGTIRDLVNIVGPDNYIPLPNVDGETLKIIQQYMNANAIENRYLRMSETLERLMMAANYLDYADLLYYLMPIWINQEDFPINSRLPDIVFLIALCFYNGDIGYLKNEYSEFLHEKLGTNRRDDLGFDIDILGNGELTQGRRLAWAAELGSVRTIQFLLNDPSTQFDPSDDDNIAILVAAQGRQIEIVKLFMEYSSVDTSEALVEAAEYGNAPIVELLMNDRTRTIDLQPALLEAIDHGRANVVQLLLTRADPSESFNAALQRAAVRGRADVMAVLLNDPRVDPSVLDNIAINRAAMRGHLEIVKMLLNDDRVDAHEAIAVAARFGNVEIVEWLLANARGRFDPEVLAEFDDDERIQKLYNQYTKRKKIGGGGEYK